jgi:DNA repair protein RadC
MTDATGHRQRLKARFMDGLGAGLADYELLELLLAHAIPRKDVKPLAKTLIAEFKSLEGVLAAAPERLCKISGMGDASTTLLKLTHALGLRTRRAKTEEKPLLANRVALMDYLYSRFAGKEREELHVLYVDAKLRLITDETVFTGTLTHTAASPREIIRRALEHNAAGLIIAHNHPSGAPTPSEADRAFTAELCAACHPLSLTLHDHLIVGLRQHFSFRGAGEL